MGDKSRLCVVCGRFIGGKVVQTDDGPTHDCGELLDECDRLREQNDELMQGEGGLVALAAQERIEELEALVLKLDTNLDFGKLYADECDENARLREQGGLLTEQVMHMDNELVRLQNHIKAFLYDSATRDDLRAALTKEEE